MSNTTTIKLDRKTEKEVTELAQVGHKIEAMKMVLDKTKCGLALAKEYVDNINPKSSVELSGEQVIALRDALRRVIPDDIYVREVAEPIRRIEPKLGRNDLCSCGSSIKYKKCCLAKSL
jgi:uncharacterized protein YecA (UPF0149 family)